MPTGTVVPRGYLAPRAVDEVRGRARARFDRCAYVSVDGGPALVLHAGGRDHTPAGERTGELLPGLVRALARRDADRVTRGVASLIGRGPGLTPSGDDALVGLLAVLHRLGPARDGSLELLGPAVAAHLHRTGDSSAHYLRLAVAGHLGERLIALRDALATDDAVDAAVAAVVATGATSGADALLGVDGGLRLLAAAAVAAGPGSGERAVAA
jgi:hypothetical protein